MTILAMVFSKQSKVSYFSRRDNTECLMNCSLDFYFSTTQHFCIRLQNTTCSCNNTSNESLSLDQIKLELIIFHLPPFFDSSSSDLSIFPAFNLTLPPFSLVVSNWGNFAPQKTFGNVRKAFLIVAPAEGYWYLMDRGQGFCWHRTGPQQQKNLSGPRAPWWLNWFHTWLRS